MTPTKVIVHHSVSKDTPITDIGHLRYYHVNVRGWRDIGYHLVIEKVGGAYEGILGRAVDEQGAHCRGENDSSLGVCFIGNFMDAAPPDDMLRVGARHISGLMRVAGIEISNETVLPHRWFANTACPGDLFPMDRLIWLMTQ